MTDLRTTVICRKSALPERGCLMLKQVVDEDYGPNNPEPMGMKDSAKVRDPARDAMHAAMEYIDGPQAVEGRGE
jgi:hypothetical protein